MCVRMERWWLCGVLLRTYVRSSTTCEGAQPPRSCCNLITISLSLPPLQVRPIVPKLGAVQNVRSEFGLVGARRRRRRRALQLPLREREREDGRCYHRPSLAFTNREERGKKPETLPDGGATSRTTTTILYYTTGGLKKRIFSGGS